METPKQQAMAANADVVQQHRDAIKMAKQQTRDIIARQKAEAAEQLLAAKQAVAEQMMANQQANNVAGAEVVEAIQDEPLKSEQVEDASTAFAEAPDPFVPSAKVALSTGAAGIGTSMSPSLQQTIDQLQTDAALEHQRMLADIAATMQHEQRSS